MNNKQRKQSKHHQIEEDIEDEQDAMLMKQLSPTSLKRMGEKLRNASKDSLQQQPQKENYKIVVIGNGEVGKSGKSNISLLFILQASWGDIISEIKLLLKKI